MKRLTVLFLLALLLCGCTAQPQEETTRPTQTTPVLTEATEPAGIYVPGSALETDSGGALRCYVPDVPQCYGMLAMGDDLLLFSGTEKTTLTRVTGENLYTIASAELGCMIYPEDTTFQITQHGITYYNPQSREVVFLDNDLKEVSRLGMSDSMIGKPILSSNRMQVYYCTGDAVRVYDLETGLDKLIKSISYERQSVEDILLGDSVLRCSLVDSQGLEYSIFLSPQTGELLSGMQYDLRLKGTDDAYFAIVPEGSMNLILFGGADGEPRVLTPADTFAAPWFLEDAHGTMTVSAEADRSVLTYYDLDSGMRTSQVTVPLQIEPWYAEADKNAGTLYLMFHDTAADRCTIARWDMSATATGDETVYTGPRYTRDARDEAGLEECRLLAQQIGEAYGVQILIGDDAVMYQPWDYELELEYQVPVIRRELEKLAKYLSHFPEGFFESIYGAEKISIVRSITGNARSGSVDSASGVQYWYGTTAYVALAAGDGLEYAFYHEMFHVIDNKVLSDSSIYYYWPNLNPAGFSYYENYTSYLTEDNSQFLLDETRAFIDAYSMSYPKEDRARIMEYACTEGNARYFQSEIMQSKLKTLCEGIRAAFRLREYPEMLLWEQYLNEPLAPAA